MAKSSALVGYVSNVKDEHNKFIKQVTERKVGGNILRSAARFQYGEAVNGSLRLSVRFSFIADRYSFEHYNNIVYVVLEGKKWVVNSIEPQRPRLILELGGVYNG